MFKKFVDVLGDVLEIVIGGTIHYSLKGIFAAIDKITNNNQNEKIDTRERVWVEYREVDDFPSLKLKSGNINVAQLKEIAKIIVSEPNYSTEAKERARLFLNKYN